VTPGPRKLPSATACRLRERYGPWALVTGASDGIGRDIAECLAAAGVNLVLSARRVPALEALARQLEETAGIETRVIPADMAVPADVETLVLGCTDLDIGLLAACAGFGTSGAFLESEAVSETAMVDVNCRAVLTLTRAFAGQFAARGGGGIVLMSSLFAFQGVPRAANYAATKAYIQCLAEGLRPELAPHGIDVIASAPGPIRSGFAARAGMVMGLSQPASAVGRETLSRLGRRGTVRPGWLSKLLETLFIGQPRRMRSWILARVVAGMTPPRRVAGPGD